MSLLNSILHVIIENGWVDEQFIAERTTDFEEVKANVADYSPEKMALITGIDAETVRKVTVYTRRQKVR